MKNIRKQFVRMRYALIIIQTILNLKIINFGQLQPTKMATLEDGYKMKWHQIGNGKVQLRLTVGIFAEAFLCEAYVKNDPKTEKRKMARFKVYLEKIRRNEYTENGRLA